MKNIYTFIILLLCLSSYSQTITEKYNSYLNRYEYFDSNGNLNGYKSYNSYLGVWEYFSNNSATYSRKPVQYAPAPKDNSFALLQQTVMQRQSDYNSNKKIIDDLLVKLNERIIDIKNYEIYSIVHKRFGLEVINFLNRSNIDFSNGSRVNEVRTFIVNKYNSIESEEYKNYNNKIVAKNEPKKTISILPHGLLKFLGSHKVYKIEDYVIDENRAWKVIKTENSPAVLNISQNRIEWKRNGASEYTTRSFTSYKKYTETGYYILESNGGDVIIENDLKTVTFHELSDVRKKYIYYINR